MLILKQNGKMLQSKVSVKYSEESSIFGNVTSSNYSIFCGGGSRWFLSLSGRGGDGVGAYSRLGAYSNKYGIFLYRLKH